MDEQLPQEPNSTVRPASISRSCASSRPRKHMGVASSDPSYLPPVDNPHAPARDREVKVPARKTSLGHGGSAQSGSAPARGGGYIPPTSPTLQVRSRGNESAGPGRNYISQPKRGRSIFTSREERRRRQLQVALVLMIIAAIALALVWFFFLRG